MGNNFKASLAAGDKMLLGLFLATASPVAAEIAAHAGYDWLLIDGEHGASEPGSYMAQLHAAGASGVPMLLRVPEGQPHIIKRALDMGIQNLIVPMVHDAAQAAEIVAMTRYAPDGIRGMGASVARVSGYGRQAEYTKTANDTICVIVQAESRAALDNIDDIAATDGVDAVFIGPADLSADMGYPGQPGAPEVVAAIEHIIARTKAAGKAAAIYLSGPAQAKHYRDMGVAMAAVGSDTTLLRKAHEDLLAAAQG